MTEPHQHCDYCGVVIDDDEEADLCLDCEVDLDDELYGDEDD